MLKNRSSSSNPERLHFDNYQNELEMFIPGKKTPKIPAKTVRKTNFPKHTALHSIPKLILSKSARKLPTNLMQKNKLCASCNKNLVLHIS